TQPCPRCRGALDPATAGFTEAGYVCQHCVLDSLAADDVQRDAGGDREDLAVLGANVVGLALAIGVGRGFVVDGPTAGERRMMAMQQLGERTAARRAANLRAARGEAIHLRRGATQVGPYTTEELRTLWDAGHVQPTDEYWYEGMGGWRPVTAFVPPGRGARNED
ncbi:MAG TPA: DUF4339 domain-containing protein, partial [Sandaracinaceae bacterium LLY-WYZ-13_1]|nr:DUF4339 domain-containing protein [Sandaracinaceae bacterium LLY-WYZ-13_1]